MQDLSKALEKFKHIVVDGVEIDLNEGAKAYIDPLKRLSDINKKIAEN